VPIDPLPVSTRVTPEPELISVILPGMAAKPRIAIVGMGNLGSALAAALKRAGYVLDAVQARSDSESLRRAPSLSKQSGGVSVRPGQTNADVVWLCVPDGKIGEAAGVLAREGNWKGKVALHSSGALTSDELEVLRQRGARVASAHPLMTFVRGSRPALAGVPFAIEGDPSAARVARRIVSDLGGRSYTIRKQDKVAYHAWATFASPLLTALLATTERVAATAGVEGREARQRMLPILRQTLANYARLGAAASFSGPIVRGDVETVNRHLRILADHAPLRDVYAALARTAVLYLPSKNRRKLEEIVQSRTKSEPGPKLKRKIKTR
jgi:predicted short-subunit dehydrogenase-like oxidoreductase (DUF2520 family)